MAGTAEQGRARGPMVRYPVQSMAGESGAKQGCLSQIGRWTVMEEQWEIQVLKPDVTFPIPHAGQTAQEQSSDLLAHESSPGEPGASSIRSS